MKRSFAVLLISAWSCAVLASPALQGGVIADLNELQSQLQESQSHASSAQQEALAQVVERATFQAERLAPGNQADQWASALYQQLAASALVRQDKPAEAADRLEIARGMNGVDSPQAARWLREEAGLRRAAGQQEQAIALFIEWLGSEQASDADVDKAIWQLTRLLAEQKRWEEAADWLERALEQTPQLNEAQQRLALVIYRQAGQGEQALAWLLDDLNADSETAEWRQAAGLAQQAGQAGMAAGLWEMAWQLGKLDQPDDFWLLIQLHRAGGTPARAAEHLEQALSAGDIVRDESHLRLLATTWQQAKHVENALSAWHSLALHTQSAEDWSRYGQLAYAWGENEQAKQAFARAADLGNEQAQAWLANFN
tara:strand:+ start:348 stop:1457 length:1110 start_codon:yes stop_codon:yes gene_type:complete